MARAIGIDLGTTNTVAAIARQGQAFPQALIMRDGGVIKRSALTFYNGTWVSGQLAEETSVIFPDCYIESSKRFIGMNFDDPRIQEDIRRLNIQSQRPRVVAPPPGESGVRFCVYPPNRAPFFISPIEVAAIILRHVKEDAEAALGEPVTHAVITVPAYFDAAQIQATHEAGEAAGFIVQHIIEEPLAAALAFGLQEQNLHETDLVYDFGGGTLDITILKINGNKFLEITKGGDNHLGGNDFDSRLKQYVVKQLTAFGLDLDASDTPVAIHYSLRQQCRKVKESLSQLPKEAIFKTTWKDHPRANRILIDSVTVTLEEYENIVYDLVDKTIMLTQEVLRKAQMTPTQIDRVLLIGGSTFTPLVRERLRAMFGKDKVQIGISPMQAVACGAAHFALSLPHEQKCSFCLSEQDASNVVCEVCGEFLIDEELPQYYGVRPEMISTIAKTISIATDEGHLVPVIKAGYQYSPTNTQTSHIERVNLYIPANGVHGLRIPFYEGEAAHASDNANHFLGECLVKDLPANIQQGEQVLVELSMNGDRVLTGHVRVRSALYPFSLDFDQWRGILLDAINEARFALEEIEDPHAHARLDALTKRSETLLANHNLDSTQGRLLKEELHHEMEAAKKEDNDEGVSKPGNAG